MIKISYLGTNYCGYQVQPNGISIQQKLNEATKALFGYPCDIVGCSRTDSGVHANEFCATVAEKGKAGLETTIPVERIPFALSAHLPEDICVFDACWVPDRFHARYDVREKEYVYRFYNRSIRNPLEEGRAFHVPKRIDGEQLQNMQRAAATLVGTRDFAAYMAQGSKVESTVRTIYRAEVLRQGDVIEFRVAANGFLYNMVRILAGTLLAVGQGKLTVEEFESITRSKNRLFAGSTMPPHGLYLNRVVYTTEEADHEN
ncbi:MAG: tRNA pseudouridine(38-40) synthase TruA [Clostridia bacterium]|nr:tRNA pseudouridine(38-40) synthase TruA [Clostridia bacterium]